MWSMWLQPAATERATSTSKGRHILTVLLATSLA
jgi:hypothetical protein